MSIELSFVLINPPKPRLLKSARHFKAQGILFGICNPGRVVSVSDLVILFGRLISDW